MKIVNIFKTSGGWANMYVILDNDFIVVIRLANENIIDIQTEDVIKKGNNVVYLGTGVGFVKVESSIIGREYTLPNDIEKLCDCICAMMYPQITKNETIEMLKQNKILKNMVSIDSKRQLKRENIEKTMEKYKKGLTDFVNDCFYCGFSQFKNVYLNVKNELEIKQC